MRACAEACLSEDTVVELVKCIRTVLDCADVCEATGRVLTQLAGSDASLIRAVLATCKACADKCESHAGLHGHCRVCAEACRRCERACRQLLDSLG
ncbi:hypothetical protein GCM10011594_32010 [Nakamurella endophytica]|uniref:Four-helix bundle copper-binding protein n=1 Tax=Nakamurella endophytica TaxID=1748367 RepID=A0A917T3M4_9ACTN|nr:hypothetical protein GCM10011594_32010 [Nakamurella endophytica]